MNSLQRKSQKQAHPANRTFLAWCLSLLSLGVLPAFAQLDLSTLNTQTVKAGVTGYEIQTEINNLDIHLEINRGIVTTQVTFDYTPSKGIDRNYQCTPSACESSGKQPCPMVCDYGPQKEGVVLDSLETAAYFNLGQNTVITDMYLWVGQTKVKAALQDRALASAQYESIVKRRRDPALLESWGNGSYNLRIFPIESGTTRRLQIEFVQGLENDGSLLATVLPVFQSLAPITYYPTINSVTGVESPNLILNYRTTPTVQLEAIAVDGKSYDLNWPGLGSGKVSALPLKLSTKIVNIISAGKISIAAPACASCLTPWTSLHAGKNHFGVKATLHEKNIKLAAEPKERRFILDVHADSKNSNEIDRARKVALLSLKTYATAPNVANLGFTNGKGEIIYAFPNAISMNETQLQIAYQAIKNWVPPAVSNAEATLMKVAKLRSNQEAQSVVYLINNDTTPYFYVPSNPTDQIQSAAQIYAAYKAEKYGAISTELNRAKIILFGFWNNYELAEVAEKTGGFQVGNLMGYAAYYGGSDLAPAIRVRDPFENLQLPVLFGIKRPTWNNLSNLKVETQGAPITDLVVFQESMSNNRYFANDMMLAKKSSLNKKTSFPGYYYNQSPDTIAIRISGQLSGSGKTQLKLTGAWGGLAFETEYEVDIPSAEGGNTLGAGIWAYQKGEVLAADYATESLKAIQQLGKEYHIVNRQMSLLALEPGMVLWSEFPSNTQQNNRNDLSSIAPIADMARPAGDLKNALDEVSLESILKEYVPIINGKQISGVAANFLTAQNLGSQIQLSWLTPNQGKLASFRILNVTGKEVASLLGQATPKGYAVLWSAPQKSGTYFIQAKAGNYKLSQMIWVNTGK